LKSAIDNIFNPLKEVAATKSKPLKPEAQEPKRLTKKSTQRKAAVTKPAFTEEGYKIYTTDELKVGKGGGTKLCPFDCECCF
jgi:hypothetical protein